jgi:hypothetical protein
MEILQDILTKDYVEVATETDGKIRCDFTNGRAGKKLDEKELIAFEKKIKKKFGKRFINLNVENITGTGKDGYDGQHFALFVLAEQEN